MIKFISLMLATAAVSSAVPATATLHFHMTSQERGGGRHYQTWDWNQSDRPTVVTSSQVDGSYPFKRTTVEISDGVYVSNYYGSKSFSTVMFDYGWSGWFNTTASAIWAADEGIENISPNQSLPVFSESAANPLFAAGTWTSAANGADAVITASATGAVPEPASWAMLIAGFGLTGAAARRRRSMAIAA